MEPLFIAFIIGIVLGFYLIGRIIFALMKAALWLVGKAVSAAFYILLGLVAVLFWPVLLLPIMLAGIILASVWRLAMILLGGLFFSRRPDRVLSRI